MQALLNFNFVTEAFKVWTVFYRVYGLKPYKYGCTLYFRTVPYNHTP